TVGQKKKSEMATQVKHVPKDAQVIMSIMKDMGITDFEPRVINQLLEFTYRYIACILDDCKGVCNPCQEESYRLGRCEARCSDDS
ncbi:hypothetical protein L9F63_019430, partial [Diploptera punctata]